MELIVSQSGEFKLGYVIDDNNTEWFKAIDVARMLNYENTQQSIRLHVDVEDRRKFHLLKISGSDECDKKDNFH
jgi:prophage antirepressor-like protein